MATEDSPSPHIPYPQWQNEYQPPSSSLTARSSRSGLQPQKPQSTSGFRKYRKVLTIAPSISPLKMRGSPLRSQEGQSGFSRLGKEVITQRCDKPDFELS